MPIHDSFWKSLIKAFFEDFLNLVVPELDSKLQAAECRFLEQESIVDFPQGKKAVLDIVAEVPARDGPFKLVLVHIEIEGRFLHRTDRRMARYFMHLQLKHDRPVLPIVLFLKGGPSGVERRQVHFELLGNRICSFSYWAFGLSRARAEDYLGRSALTAALAACMKGGDLTPPERKFSCQVEIAKLKIDDARKFLLLDAVETYIDLDEADQVKYSELASVSLESEMVSKMNRMWSERIAAQTARDTLISVAQRMLDHRFGPIPPDVKDHLEQMDDRELEELGPRLLDAASLKDLGFDQGC